MLEKLKQKFKKTYILGRYPERDWQRLFGCFVILLALVVCWSGYIYFAIKSEVPVESGLLSNTTLLTQNKAKEIQDTINFYQSKKDAFSNLTGSAAANYVPPPVVVATSSATSSDAVATSSTARGTSTSSTTR